MATDLTKMAFTLVSGTPCVAKSQGTWDGSDIANPDVVWDPAVGQWLMSYSGYSSGSSKWSLGLAYSPDLYTWTRFSGNPVSAPAAGEGNINSNGSVVYFGGQYCNYYQIGNADGMYLATSPNRTTWTRYVDGSSNPIKVIAAPAGNVSPTNFDFCVRPYGAGLEAAFASSISSGIRRFYRSTSADGTTWATPALLPLTVCPNMQYNRGEPGFVRSGNLLILCHDGGASTTEVLGNSVGRRINLHVSADNGSTWDYREDVMALPSGIVNIFDSSLVIHNSTLHLFFAGGTGTSGGSGMSSQIYHATARLPYTSTPRRRAS